jgi:predicted porin
MTHRRLALAFAIALAGSAHAQTGIDLHASPQAALAGCGSVKLTIGTRAAAAPAFKGAAELGPGLKLAGYDRFGVLAASCYGEQERSGAIRAADTTSAWVVGATYALATGTVLLGYGRTSPEGLAATRQWSLGYEYPLSRRTFVYADASDKKAAGSVRQIDLGIRAAF